MWILRLEMLKGMKLTESNNCSQSDLFLNTVTFIRIWLPNLINDWLQEEQAHRLTGNSSGCNIVAIEQQLMGTASLIKEMSGKRTSVIDSTHCITKAILCPGNNDVDHTSKEVTSLAGKSE
jgi:hypothetical protein